MVQIDYEITIYYKAFFIKNSFQGRYPPTPAKGGLDINFHPPYSYSGGGKPPHTPPLGYGVQTWLNKTFEHKEDNQAPHPKNIPLVDWS